MTRQEPHWMLSDQDAKTYGAALANAMRHVPIGVTQKALDFSALIMTAITMETPRVYRSMALRADKRRAAQERQREPQGATVYQLHPNNPQPPPPSAPSPASQQPQGGGVEGFTGDGVDGPIGGVH